MNNIPRYIGFLEYLKTPSVTKDEAKSGCNGFIVVCDFLNDFTAKNINKRPDPRIKILRALNSGKV